MLVGEALVKDGDPRRGGRHDGSGIRDDAGRAHDVVRRGRARLVRPPDDRVRWAVHARGADRRPRRARRVAWREAMADPAFVAEFDTILRRATPAVPSPLFLAERAQRAGGLRASCLKREDLNHTGAHKIRNVLGQALLTKRMGKTRVIAETGRGPARRGERDRGGATSAWTAPSTWAPSTPRRQALNVARMNLLGAKVVPVESGSAHAEGRHQRGVARLGRERRPHRLPLRHGGRSAPVPEHGARLHPRHRRRGPGPVPGEVRRASRRHRGLRGRRLERHRACSPRSSTTPTSPSTASSRAATASTRPGTLPPSGRGRPRRAARRAHLRAPGRGRADHRVPLDLRGSRLPGRRPPARLPRPDRAGPPTSRHRRRGDGGAARCSAAPRASSRPSSRRTPWPAACRSPSGSRPRRAGGHGADQPQRPRRQGHPGTAIE